MATRDPSPEVVADRLKWLRERYVPEDALEARARLEEAPDRRSTGTFAEAVAHRLEELRALCDLTIYLHRARPRLEDGP